MVETQIMIMSTSQSTNIILVGHFETEWHLMKLQQNFDFQESLIVKEVTKLWDPKWNMQIVHSIMHITQMEVTSN